MSSAQLLFPEIAASDAVNVCHPPVCVGAPASLLAEVGGEGGNQTGSAVDCTPSVGPALDLTLVGGLLPHPAACGGECSGSEKRKGRRAVHVSAAARKAAYRADKARVDFTDKPEIIATLNEISADLDCSKNELLQSLVRFALTNRNWKQCGLYGARRDGVLQ